MNLAEVMTWLEDALSRNQIVHESDIRTAASFIAEYKNEHAFEFQIGGVTHLASKYGLTYAKCCGSHKCTSECKAIIHHGPGHQSRTHCQVKGPHDEHQAVYGEFQELAVWRGDETFSGAFNEPPRID